MMIKKFLIVVLSIFIVGCHMQPINLPQDRDFSSVSEGISPTTVKTKTAVLLPLSGESAAVGEHFRNAALMAQLERSSNDATEVLFFDSQGTPLGAVNAYQQAQQERPDVILGPVFSSEVNAVAAQNSSVPVISFTSDTSVLNANTYSLALLIPQQIDRIVDFACQQGQTRFAVLGPNDKTGELVMRSFSKAVQTCPGMRLTQISLYNPNSTNLTAAVTKIAPPLVDGRRKNLSEHEKELLKNPSASRLSFDALFVFEQGVKLQQLVSLLNYYDVTPNLVAFYGLATLRQSYNKDLVGAYFPDLPQEKLEIYRQNYQEAFGKEPLLLSALAYDAVSLVAFLSQNNALSQVALTTPDGYQGINGRFRLNPDGTNNRLLEMFQIQGRNNFIKISDAPVYFKEETVSSFSGF